MSRSAILSNGRLAVGLDERGFVHDFYYPYVGLNNVTSARSVKHKMGIWVDGDFSWLDSSQWSGTTTLDEHSLMSHTLFVSDKYGISIHMRDFVDNEQDVFGRVVIVENRFNKVRDVRLFFGRHSIQWVGTRTFSPITDTLRLLLAYELWMEHHLINLLLVTTH